jgi:ABC-type Zn2+ transport system substrate-binding protein/surface adhesin
MELHAPGADIVGFEYGATSAEDRAAVDAAVATLARPLDLFVLPDVAACTVVQASAELDAGESEDDDHAAHSDEDHGHEEHANKDNGHDDHGDDHGHDEDHAEAAGHTEFHAAYLLTCAKTDAVSEIGFAYFETFPNAQELEVQVITDTGAQAFEVTRDAPSLDLRTLF